MATDTKAVIQTQGQQWMVQVGDIFKVMRYPHTEAGSILEIKEVLLYEDASGVHIGKPTLKNASVRVKVLENKRGKKVVILKHHRRGGYQRKQGFRQALSVIQVEAIEWKQ